MKKLWYPLVALALGLLIYVVNLQRPPENAPKTAVDLPLPKPEPMPTPSTGPQTDAQPPSATFEPAPLKLGTRAFYGQLPSKTKDLADLPMVNKPSKQWQSKLRQILLRTGGDQLKELQVEPQESYIIMDGEEGRNVERVIVTVKAKDGRFTRFFAEVDSESGHVTKSWGAVIHENNDTHKDH